MRVEKLEEMLLDKLVGEDALEIVEFKTASSVKTAQRTQELLKDISQDGGVNVITMDLPPIKQHLQK